MRRPAGEGGGATLEAEELGFTIAMVTATGLIDAALVDEIVLVGKVKKMLGLPVRIVAEGVGG